MLLPCWALGAEPPDVLVALQSSGMRKVVQMCIVIVIPFSQEGVLTLSKPWTLDPFWGNAHCGQPVFMLLTCEQSVALHLWPQTIGHHTANQHCDGFAMLWCQVYPHFPRSPIELQLQELC